jgi:hypothetical protein
VIIRPCKVVLEPLPNKITHEPVQESQLLWNGECTADQERLENRSELQGKNKVTTRLCIYCGKMFKWLPVHVKRHHSNVFKCTYNLCIEFFKSETERLEHIQKVHAEKEKIMMSCIICHKTILYNNMKRHLQSHSSKKVIKCTFNCSTLFKSEEQQKLHEMQVHKVEEREQCIYCDLSYLSRMSLSRHIQEKHQSEAIRCLQHKCDTFFLTEDLRDKHI